MTSSLSLALFRYSLMLQTVQFDFTTAFIIFYTILHVDNPMEENGVKKNGDKRKNGKKGKQFALKFTSFTLKKRKKKYEK